MGKSHYNVTAPTRGKILELVGKTLIENFSRKAPQFCVACVNRVQELYPQVNTPRILAHDEAYDEPVISGSDDILLPPNGEIYPQVNTLRSPAHDDTYDEPGIS